MTLTSSKFEVDNNVINLNGLLYTPCDDSSLYVRSMLNGEALLVQLEEVDCDKVPTHSFRDILEMSLEISTSFNEMSEHLQLNGFGYEITGVKPLSIAMKETTGFGDLLFQEIPKDAPIYSEFEVA